MVSVNIGFLSQITFIGLMETVGDDVSLFLEGK